MTSTLIIRQLGLCDYHPVWEAMQAFTDARTSDTRDELWLLQHPPVFTLGRNGKQEHLHDPGDIPVVPVDRGGQITYHGPGQLVAYLLIDVQRRGQGVRWLVDALEQTIIRLLTDHDIDSKARRDAPGVYVNNAKIAALGLRVRKGCSYHGLSLNVDMDLEPFSRIDPCGFAGLEITQLVNHIPQATIDTISPMLVEKLVHELGYDKTEQAPGVLPGENEPVHRRVNA